MNVLLKKSIPDLRAADLDDDQILWHEIDLSTVKSMIGWEETTSSSKDMKRAVKELMKCVVEWNTFERDETTWHACTLCPEAKIHKGKLRYYFPVTMRKEILHPKIFARLQMRLLKMFRSKFSLLLYELTVDYRENVWGEGQPAYTMWIDIDKFRRYMLGTEDAEKKNLEFCIFKRNVINVAVKEVNKITEIRITPEYKRAKGRGRPVQSIRFKVVENPGTQAGLEEQGQMHIDDAIATSNAKADFIKRLSNIGINPTTKKVRKVLSDKSLEHLEAAFEYAIAHIRERNYEPHPEAFLDPSLPPRRKEKPEIKSELGFIVKQLEKGAPD